MEYVLDILSVDLMKLQIGRHCFLTGLFQAENTEQNL